MKSGELIVSGIGQAQFELDSAPIKIDVYYNDSGEIIVPCNPSSHDTLNWTISGSILTINWKVAGIRAIKYDAWNYWSEVKA